MNLVNMVLILPSHSTFLEYYLERKEILQKLVFRDGTTFEIGTQLMRYCRGDVG